VSGASGRSGRLRWGVASLALFVGLPVGLPVGSVHATLASSSKVIAIGAENQYANVIAQIGGRDVRVTAIMSNPATDPHTYEASPQVAQKIANAALVVQNGAGYDTFMRTIEAASPNARRKVIVVRRLLHRSGAIANPHLWYAPSTMPVVAAKIAQDLAALDPSHRRVFERNLARFDRSLSPWKAAIAALRRRFPHAPVATTEPVADDMLQAAGIDDKTPFAFQSDVMNGVDPSPQDLATEQNLLKDHKVRALVYNQQVTDTVTQSLLAIARQHHIPVVGVYETMPTPGYDYQTWMTAEVRALINALAHGTSAPTL
jgi:zinc/manganese transport system substrate-binding protein